MPPHVYASCNIHGERLLKHNLRSFAHNPTFTNFRRKSLRRKNLLILNRDSLNFLCMFNVRLFFNDNDDEFAKQKSIFITFTSYILDKKLLDVDLFDYLNVIFIPIFKY